MSFYFMLIHFVYFNNKNNEGIRIFKNMRLYTAYADYSTFFLKTLASVNELLNKIYIFSSFIQKGAVVVH